MNNAFWDNPIVHAVVTVFLFLIPVVIAQGGSWQQVTLGTVLVALYKVVKNKSSGLTVGGSHR
jgi:hypothetical protein